MSGETNTPKNNSNPLLFVFIGLGGLVLLCAGGCAGTWFWYLKPKAEEVAQKVDQIQQIQKDLQTPPKDEFFTWDKVKKLKAGMARRDVFFQLGEPKLADEAMIDVLAPNVPPEGRERFLFRWKARFKQKTVWAYQPNDGGLLLVCYDSRDRLIGMVGQLEGVTEYIPLPLDPSEQKTEDTTPVATLTIRELEEQATKYLNKWVVVKGRYFRSSGGEGAFDFVGLQKTITVRPPRKERIDWQEPPEPLETVEIIAKVMPTDSDRHVLLTFGKLRERIPAEKPVEVSALDLTTEYDKDATAAAKKYEGKILKVSGETSSSSSAGNYLTLRGLQDLRQKKGLFVDCRFEQNDREPAMNIGLQTKVAVIGLFNGLPQKNVSGATVLHMVLCRVVK